MTKWKYMTLAILYDGKKAKDWVVTYSDGTALVGLPAVLEAYGEQGWELVGLIPERFDVSPMFGRWAVEPASYRATFKRPAGEAEGATR